MIAYGLGTAPQPPYNPYAAALPVVSAAAVVLPVVATPPALPALTPTATAPAALPAATAANPNSTFSR